MAATLDNPLISVRDSGIHGQYGTNRCVTDRVDNYLINGILPASRSECPADVARPQVPADQAGTNGVPTRPSSKEARVKAALEHHSLR
jgi:TAP-like protein